MIKVFFSHGFTPLDKDISLKHQRLLSNGVNTDETLILGYGFLERVYQKALQVELLRRRHSVEIEHPIKVEFKRVIVGEYEADLLVDEKIVVELKVAKKYNSKDEPQLLNELRAQERKVGLLINS